MVSIGFCCFVSKSGFHDCLVLSEESFPFQLFSCALSGRDLS